MRVFKSKHFDRFAHQADLDDVALLVAAIETRAGLHDGDLGGGVFKKRVARKGGGKSGGFRTLLVCSNPAFTVFVYGFAKNDRSNASAAQLAAFKSLSKLLRAYSLEWAQSALVELEVSHGN